MTDLAQTAASTVRALTVAYEGAQDRRRLLCYVIETAALLLAEIVGFDRVSQCFAAWSREHADRARRLNPGQRRRS